MQQEVKKMISAPEMKAKLDDLGLAGVASTPEEFRKFIEQDIRFQAHVMKLAKVEKQ
ncbi:hypothetical protein D3C83_287000 [compost metagenome]